MPANKFLVPQFIDVEPKIIGPITVRQFIIMVVGMLVMFIEYRLLDFWGFIISAVVTFGVFGTIAFLKVNGRPFHYFFLNIIETFKAPRLMVWRKEMTTQQIKDLLATDDTEEETEKIPVKPMINKSHLEELSLIVNTGGAYRPTNDEVANQQQ